ncbi:hexosaminidase [Nakamurella sp. UYEF19]|uniref:beta-N-acetylhexosaminidase n=1 Tax=Nakamurella sp. UYEF19 TaxID=1756392 RepID=UPI00339389B1
MRHSRAYGAFHPFRPFRTVALLAALSLTVAGLAVPAAAADPLPAAVPASAYLSTSAPAISSVVPKPVTSVPGTGVFTLAKGSRIVATQSATTSVARSLGADLRPSTGFALPVVSGPARNGDITLSLGAVPGLSADQQAEGYRVEVTTHGVLLQAKTTHGLFNAVQTLRQLLPSWIDSPTRRSGPWTISSTRITDYPRYAYRGIMLDIARHFESPAVAEELIDQASAYKINTFHLHLSDDQGFRIVINGFPRLTSIGAKGAVGTDGRTVDPGGFWTQAQYRSFVAYAAAHFMTVIPEVDSPGHTNAIINAEFGDTANPYLDGHPADINCSTNHPPVWNYTGDVGYSALCPESANTWTLLTAIVQQLGAMSSSRYYDLGGDETPSTTLAENRYAALVNREARIVKATGKTAMGWAEISGPGTTLAPGSVAEYWNPASGSDPDTVSATDAVKKHMKIVMAPATHAYLDQRYTETVPAVLGQTWACEKGCDIDQFYNWDPSTYVTGVTDHDVIGVEGAMWTETIRNLSEIDYLVMPRLLALAELAWSPKVTRTVKSPAYQYFLGRLGAQGDRLQAAGVNFYPTPEVRWRLDLTAGAATLDRTRTVQGPLATVAAPGRTTDTLTVKINWGDGHSSPGTLSGDPAVNTSINGLYAVQGDHTYSGAESHRVTITVSAPGTATVTTSVSLRSNR